MATINQDIAKVQNRLIDVSVNVTAEVEDLVQEAIKEVQDRKNFTFMKRHVDAVTNNLPATPHLICPTPSDFKQFRERPTFIQFTQGHVINMTYVGEVEKVRRMVDDQRVGMPRYIARDIDAQPSDGFIYFLVYPLSDHQSDYADGEYRIRMPYWGYLADITGDVGNEITNDRGINAFVVAWATKLGFELDHDGFNADRWEKKAELLWRGIRFTENSNVLAGTDILVPIWQGADWPAIGE